MQAALRPIFKHIDMMLPVLLPKLGPVGREVIGDGREQTHCGKHHSNRAPLVRRSILPKKTERSENRDLKAPEVGRALPVVLYLESSELVSTIKGALKFLIAPTNAQSIEILISELSHVVPPGAPLSRPLLCQGCASNKRRSGKNEILKVYEDITN
jgi:hypothetical protein